MEEVSSSELRRLRQLEERIVSTNDTLSAVRLARDEARNEAKALRAAGREKDKEIRDLVKQIESLSKQVDSLVQENGTLATELENNASDQKLLTTRAEGLTEENTALKTANEALTADSRALSKTISALTADRNRLTEQLQQVTAQLDGGEAVEVKPEQLSMLLSDFVKRIGEQTGLRNSGTELNLKVGFTGRNGGGFVVPSAGADVDKFPELHDIKIELTPRSLESGI